MLTCSIGNPPTTPHPPGPESQASSLILITTCMLSPFYRFHVNRRRRVKTVNMLPGLDELRSPCHGKAITGTAGGLCTPTGQPRFPAALVYTHLHQINACPLILSGPLSHSSQHRCCRKTETQKRGTAAPNHAAPSSLCAGRNHPHGHRGRTVQPEKASQGTETLPFDSTLSPSRSSRLSPAPTARQNITISSISSAWLLRLYVRPSVCSVGLLLRSGLCVAARPGRLCPCEALRRAASAGFVSRFKGSGGSRKQPANISGVRGQRLADSNPIKHRLTQPWRRAGAGSESSRAVPCGSALKPSKGGGDNPVGNGCCKISVVWLWEL